MITDRSTRHVILSEARTPSKTMGIKGDQREEGVPRKLGMTGVWHAK